MFKEKAKEKLCESCPMAKAADLLGDNWTVLVVRDLLSGPKRFGELYSSLSGISTRTLTKKLNVLTEAGVVSRATFKEKPPRVEYSLTKMGQDLHEIAEAMRAFGKKHL
jgi:DNA-binding HxlR family transcriptional regulator